MSDSQIIIEQFSSQTLQNNPLNDPATRKLPIYLPPGYGQDDTRYPVIYLLVGFAGRGAKLLNDNFWDENIQERMDRLIAAGSVQPMILVMPDASTRYGGAQYLNSPVLGSYADYILEIVEHVDANYRTIAGRDHRAIAGHSSGGYGALLFGMRHPETFSMVADHSGDKYFELAYKPDIPKFLRFFEKAGEEGLLEVLDDPKAALRQGTSFYAIAMAAMAACYSPNPDSPFGFDLPFNPYTGELHDDIWQRWLDLDPVNLVEEYARALRSLNLLYFDCGIYDQYNLLYGARILAQRLDGLDIDYQYEEFEGGHNNIQYRYDISLEAISNTIQER